MCGRRTLLCVLGFICSVVGNSDASIGTSCITTDDSIGSCQYLKTCKAATEALSRKMFPKICEFNRLNPIVCCPETQDKSQVVRSSRNQIDCKTFLEPGGIRFLSDVKKYTSRRIRTPGVIADKKCKEYAKYAYEKVRRPTLSNRKPDNEFTEILECAIDNNPLVSKGKEAKIKEFPHTATIGFEVTGSADIVWNCGGSLISENYVLTAAHCFTERDSVAKYVRFGITNITDRHHLQVIEIEEIKTHPLYVKEKYHDIALLKLKSNLHLDPYVRPACLNTKEHIPPIAVASGFGALSKDGSLSDMLMKVTLDIYEQKDCGTSYKNVQGLHCGIIEDLMVCAGSKVDKGRDTCPGDSGGPLQMRHSNNDIECMYDIVGITSFGKAGCGINSNKNPGVYTRVSSYIEWIEDIVWPNET